MQGANKRYKCALCRKQFTAKAGLIFEVSKISLRKWFAAIYLVLSHKKGQKQRILIARSVFKNPAYLFFDEATNGLDTTNENEIVSSLRSFFKGKTVIIIAHRLSTVKNADKIVVLRDGKIIEVGTHNELSVLKGNYYELARNQYELTN